MHDASRRLQDCLAEMYDPEWFGKEEMDTLVEVRCCKQDKTPCSSSLLSLSCCGVPRCLVCLVSDFLDVTRFLFLNCLRFLKEMIEKEMDNNLEVKVRAGELG